MKTLNLLFSLLLLVASAKSLAVVIEAESAIPFGNMTTFKNPVLVLGDRKLKLYIQDDNSLVGICKQLGFSSYLRYSYKEKGNISYLEQATLNSSGDIVSSGLINANYIQEITCLNGQMIELNVSAEKITLNADTTTTIKNPILTLGDRKLKLYIQDDNSLVGLCKRLGFSSYLRYSYKEKGNKSYLEQATLNSSGDIVSSGLINANYIQELTCTGVSTKLNKGKTRSSAIELTKLSRNLEELSKVVYDSRAKMLLELSKDLDSDDIKSEGLSSNVLLLYAMNSFVNQLTSQDVEQNIKPKYADFFEKMKGQGWNSVDQVNLDRQSLNMAISITKNTLIAILSSSSMDEKNAASIKSLIAKLAGDVSSVSGDIRKELAYAEFSQSLVQSGVLTTALENPRTAPEASMLNLVSSWIVKKY